MLSHNNRNNLVFYILVFFGLLIVLFSNPFLRYPYDAIAHLIAIDNLFNHLPNSTSIQDERLIWHGFWASFFTLFHIESKDIFLRAKMIHVIQIYVTFFSIYYFSHVVIRNIFQNIPILVLKYLALWSLLIWISIFATFSGYYHQIWSLWYSVNYQITLPLFFYITALTLVLFLEITSLKKQVFFSLQILLISGFILQVHAMEFMYYLMYLFIFSLLYIDKLYLLIKRYYLILFIILASMIYLIKNNLNETSKIFLYFNTEKLPLLFGKIMEMGNILTHSLKNRAFSCINELMYLIYYLSIIIIIYFIWAILKKKDVLNTRIFIFILITSSFIFIPLYPFSAGLFAMITRIDVLHRLYFSSSIFLLLPIFVYYILQNYTIKLRYINLVIIVLLLSVAIFSKHNAILSHNYYKNLYSIKNSFLIERLIFHLSSEDIVYIGKKLEKYEKKHPSKKEIYYYARADIAFVIKYIYHKNVYWEGRRANPNFIKHFNEDKISIEYQKILFDTPKIFPRYVPYW